MYTYMDLDGIERRGCLLDITKAKQPLDLFNIYLNTPIYKLKCKMCGTYKDCDKVCNRQSTSPNLLTENFLNMNGGRESMVTEKVLINKEKSRNNLGRQFGKSRRENKSKKENGFERNVDKVVLECGRRNKIAKYWNANVKNKNLSSTQDVGNQSNENDFHETVNSLFEQDSFFKSDLRVRRSKLNKPDVGLTSTFLDKNSMFTNNSYMVANATDDQQYTLNSISTRKPLKRKLLSQSFRDSTTFQLDN